MAEFLLDEPANRVPELRLAMDPTKDYSNGQYGFVDMFICPRINGPCLVLELKTLTLSGLLQKSNENVSNSELERMQSEIDEDTESGLLKRRYSYWTAKGIVKTTVGDMVEDAIQQLTRYMWVISIGRPSANNPGASDPRVRRSEGKNVLEGYVIMSIGRRRVLIHRLTQHDYELT